VKQSYLKLGGLCVLVVLLAAIGLAVVPRHETSIWMDTEFTDWISPIANQLHGETRLYTDGLHIPMPPLPFVVLRLLHPGGALWIDENRLHFIFQAATILLLYLLFCQRVGVPLAFVAATALVPIFFALAKKILYDSMTQFLVVACAACVVSYLESLDTGPGKRSKNFSLWVPLLGTLTALLLLSKQSTGMGGLLGIGFTLLLLPAAMPFSQRCRNTFMFACFLVAAFVVIGLALSPFASFSGMLQDVFIICS